MELARMRLVVVAYWLGDAVVLQTQIGLIGRPEGFTLREFCIVPDILEFQAAITSAFS